MSTFTQVSLEDFFALRRQLPVADVRSPGEYLAGHIPGTHNIPILNDEERKAVGTDYKQQGQQVAILTGFKLVGPRLPEILQQAAQVAKSRELVVHCWRGGMRSANFCQFVGMTGIRSYLLEGGYKRYRQAAVEAYTQPWKLTVIGGRTGSGKSEVLRALGALGEQILDLEDLASHKGSVFGGLTLPPQPVNEQFQNLVFEKLMTLDPARRVWVEDESLAIGHVFVPDPFWKQMCVSPTVELVVDREVRVSRLVEEYGIADPAAFIKAMEKIVKRLGGQNFNAVQEHVLAGDWPAAIRILLDYYDKAYEMSFVKHKAHRIGAVQWAGKIPETAAEDMILLASTVQVGE